MKNQKYICVRPNQLNILMSQRFYTFTDLKEG
jgi:hypothetical protein